MRRKLWELIQIIEEYFIKEVWHTKPPIKEEDLKLAVLVPMMNAIRIHIKLETIEDINKEIANLKSHIQQEFNIPLKEEELNNWLKQDETRRKIVLDIYKRL